MSLLERPTVGIDMSKPISVARPAVKISLHPEKSASVNFYTGPTGLEHFVNDQSYGCLFEAAGWLTLRNGDGDMGELVYPWDKDKAPTPSRFRRGPSTQAIIYISGIDPSGISFESLDGEELESAHTEGSFDRAHGVLVQHTKPTVVNTYTHRDELTNIAGVDRLVVYSAVEPARLFRPWTH